jgi:N-acetylneuraminic acid mutarotase
MSIFLGCSDEDEETFDPELEENSKSFFPLEEGKYWKYNCTYKHGTTGNLITEEDEYEVIVQVVSKNSDNEYQLQVIYNSCNIQFITITVQDNGDYKNGEKFLFCKSSSNVKPENYKSILGIPLMSGEDWDETGEINISESGDKINTSFTGNEVWVGSLSGSTGKCEHSFTERYKKAEGLEYSSYTKTAEIKSWNTYYGSYIYAYSFSSWIYTLKETGIDKIINDSVTPVWNQKNKIDEDIELINSLSFTIGENGYAGFNKGNSVLDNYSNQFYTYVSGADIWQSISSLPDNANSRNEAAAFVLNGKGYVCGGKKYVLYGTNYYLNDMWAYDPTNDSWASKNSFPRPGGIMNGIAFSIEDYAYVGLGTAGFSGSSSPYGDMNDFFKYDPAKDSWEKLSDFPGEPRSSAVGFSMNGMGYVGLGYSYDMGFTNYNDFWEYNPENDTWTQLPDFPGNSSTEKLIGYGVNNHCYVGMGQSNELYIFDRNSKKWSSVIVQECMPSRSGAVSFLIGDKIYYGAGSPSTYVSLSDFWEYDTSNTEPIE